MSNIPGPSEKDPAEGSREIVERELKRTEKPASRAPVAQQSQASMNAGDEAPPGTAGTGETVCPECQGTGRRRGATCAHCGGSGKITQGIGGG